MLNVKRTVRIHRIPLCKPILKGEANTASEYYKILNKRLCTDLYFSSSTMCVCENVRKYIRG